MLFTSMLLTAKYAKRCRKSVAFTPSMTGEFINVAFDVPDDELFTSRVFGLLLCTKFVKFTFENRHIILVLDNHC